MNYLLLASIFTYCMTTLGAAVVFCFRHVNRRLLDVMLGCSSGIMVAAAFWSLLLPATTLATELWQNSWLLPGIGWLIGGGFVILSSLFLNHQLHATGGKKRGALLVSAITLHNIPEGMAVGVSFSGFILGTAGCSFTSAIMVALGIGIQNFPDGLAVSVPLYRDGMSKGKAFLFGQASGLVEPFAAIIGYLATIAVRGMLPFLLAFAAGAMIAVVINELIPDIQAENQSLATLGFVCGFTILMILDLLIVF